MVIIIVCINVEIVESEESEVRETEEKQNQLKEKRDGEKRKWQRIEENPIMRKFVTKIRQMQRERIKTKIC